MKVSHVFRKGRLRRAFPTALAVLATVALSLLASGGALAQGGALTYGGIVVGTLSAEAPLAFFTFIGNPGDVVTARVTALTPGMEVVVSLLSPTQQQLANSTADPLSTPGDAQLPAGWSRRGRTRSSSAARTPAWAISSSALRDASPRSGPRSTRTPRRLRASLQKCLRRCSTSARSPAAPRP
ncbi:MAG: hypothetical protein M5R40_27110 [Anaerolineae bacterium]|nr:hypothetical protein [Anaerolineae bacterium]